MRTLLKPNTRLAFSLFFSLVLSLSRAFKFSRTLFPNKVSLSRARARQGGKGEQEEEEEEEEAQESLFRGQRRERGEPRARPRYPGVESVVEEEEVESVSWATAEPEKLSD